MRYFLLLVIALLSIGFSTAAFGHKVRIFAYSEGELLVGETAFSGGKKPRNVAISVLDKNSGEILGTTTSDERGKFQLPIPQKAKDKQLDLKLVVNVGEGHRGEWLLEASEYLPDIISEHTHDESISEKTLRATPHTSSQPLAVTPEQLQVIVEQAVEKQLGPVKEMLAANRDKKVSLQDILGGIGYLLGLAGIGAYIQTKKEKKQ